jgi:hypothetical protein
VDKYFLDNEEIKQLASTVHPIKHNIRNIKHLKIPLNDQNENKYTYKLCMYVYFCTELL